MAVVLFDYPVNECVIYVCHSFPKVSSGESHDLPAPLIKQRTLLWSKH
jgi:hypothetical protein